LSTSEELYYVLWHRLSVEFDMFNRNRLGLVQLMGSRTESVFVFFKEKYLPQKYLLFLIVLEAVQKVIHWKCIASSQTSNIYL